MAGAAGVAGVPGATGAAGSPGATGACCTGAAGACCDGKPADGDAGAAGAALGVLDMMDEPPPLPATKASDREVSMKIIAALVVSLLINVLPPPAPKTDWLPLAPKEAPISAPLPDCSKTTMIRAKQTITCRVTRKYVIKAITSGEFQKVYLTQLLQKDKLIRRNGRATQRSPP